MPIARRAIWSVRFRISAARSRSIRNLPATWSRAAMLIWRAATSITRLRTSTARSRSRRSTDGRRNSSAMRLRARPSLARHPRRRLPRAAERFRPSNPGLSAKRTRRSRRSGLRRQSTRSSALAHRAEDALLLRNRGYAYLKTGDHAAAVKDLERSVALKSDHALAEYDRALAISPSLPRAVKLKEEALAARGSVAATTPVPSPLSANAAPPSTAAKPSSADPQLARAALLFHQRKYDDALEEIDRAIAQQPNAVVALQLRSAIRLQKKQLPQALADLDIAAKAAPRDVNVRLQRGSLLALTGQHERALADFDQALSIK